MLPETCIPSCLLKGFRGGATYHIPKEQLQQVRFRTQLSKAPRVLSLVHRFVANPSSEFKQKEAVDFLSLLSVAFRKKQLRSEMLVRGSICTRTLIPQNHVICVDQTNRRMTQWFLLSSCRTWRLCACLFPYTFEEKISSMSWYSSLLLSHTC